MHFKRERFAQQQLQQPHKDASAQHARQVEAYANSRFMLKIVRQWGMQTLQRVRPKKDIFAVPGFMMTEDQGNSLSRQPRYGYFAPTKLSL